MLSSALQLKPFWSNSLRSFYLQCFDLASFLNSNVNASGGRWRCIVCEKFLSIYDLELCGLAEDLIREFRDKLIPSTRDGIEFSSNKSCRLLEERKDKSNKKKRGGGNLANSNPAVKKKSAPKQPIEIICLDD